MKKIIILFILFAFQTKAQKNTLLKNHFHEFDFWLGTWDVYKYQTDTLAGKSNIESIIDSVGLQENYSTVKGNYRGKSLNKYNPSKERWEQYWIDNSGLTLFLTGSFINGRMVLNDKENGNPKQGLNQITWERMRNGCVRQTWSLSKDGGKSWIVLFDGEYKKSK